MAETQSALAPNGGQLEPKLKPGDQATAMDFTTGENFALLQRVAGVLAASSLVPNEYKNNMPNCIIALNMAQRIGADPLMVMQNLYIVHGRPGWSAQFVIATFNHCGRFSAMRYEWKGEQGKLDWGCRAWAVEHLTGEKLYGAWITWELVKAEQWDAKNGSKWKTMPEQMFLYRAGAWFVRAYAPEIAMGLHTVEELRDIPTREIEPGSGNYETHFEAMPDLSQADLLLKKLREDRERTDEAQQPPADPQTNQPPAASPAGQKPTQAAKPEPSQPTGERGRLVDAFQNLIEAQTLKVARDTLESATGHRTPDKVPDGLLDQAIGALVERAKLDI